MSEISSTDDQLSQRNGHASHDLLQPDAQITGNFSSTPAPPFSLSSTPYHVASSPEPDGAEWSSLTQDLLDSLPQVWTRGLLYLLQHFSAS